MMLLPPRFATQVLEFGAGSVRIGVAGDIDLVSAPGFRRALLTGVAAVLPRHHPELIAQSR